MVLCGECINKEKCGVKGFFGEGKLLLSHCKNFIGEAPREIKTNFQRISASPEALAEFIENHCSCINCPTECPAKELCNDYKSCRRAMVEWLKQESDAE